MPPYSAKRVCTTSSCTGWPGSAPSRPYQRRVALDGARGLAQQPRADRRPRAAQPQHAHLDVADLRAWRPRTGPIAMARSRAAGVSLTMRQPPSGQRLAAARSRCPSRRPRARPARRARAATPPPASRSCRRGRCRAPGAAPPRPRARARGSRCPAGSAPPERPKRSLRARDAHVEPQAQRVADAPGSSGAGRSTRQRRAVRRGAPRGAARLDVDAGERPRAAARPVRPHAQPDALERRGAGVDEGDVLGAGQRAASRRRRRSARS